MNNISNYEAFQSAMRDQVFTNSDFFPNHVPLSGDQDVKNMLVELHAAHEVQYVKKEYLKLHPNIDFIPSHNVMKQYLQEHKQYSEHRNKVANKVSLTALIMKEIFDKTACQSLTACLHLRSLNKKWKCLIDHNFFTSQWKRFKDDTVLNLVLEDIEKRFENKQANGFQLFKKLFAVFGFDSSIESATLTPEHLKKLLQNYSLKMVWRNFLYKLIADGAPREKLPEMHADDDSIRKWLNSHPEIVTTIYVISIENEPLYVIPKEFEIFTELRCLRLNNCRLSKIEFLNNLMNLKICFLRKNQIQKIEGLSSCKELEILNLCENPLNEIKNLLKKEIKSTELPMYIIGLKECKQLNAFQESDL